MRCFSFVSIPKSLRGVRVLVRVDFNEPITNGRIGDSFRIRRTTPTIRLLRRRGARAVLISHLENEKKKPLSLAPFCRSYEKFIGEKIIFAKNYNDPQALQKAPLVLLENVRLMKGEELNSAGFARELASLGDVYINEAFSVSHRSHASIVGLPRYMPAYPGPLFQKEIAHLSEALTPPHPFLLIVGGAKFATKFALLKSFLPKADAIMVGGTLANTFLSAEGLRIGKSAYEPHALRDIRKHFLNKEKILLPFDAGLKGKKPKSVFELSRADKIFDIGPKTVQMLLDLSRLTKLVVWNGPLGYIEGGYTKGTKDLLRGLARQKTKVIIGGGDTLAVLDQMRPQKEFYHVSTGGGAMLDFLADGKLPGIDAILRSQARFKKR